MHLPNSSSASPLAPYTGLQARQRRKRKASGGFGPYAEPLERRIFLASVPVTLDIKELLQFRNPDDGNPVGGDGDYYVKVKIGDDPVVSTDGFRDNPVSGGHLINPPFWSFTSFIDPAAGLVPVRIELWDSDVGSDQVVDINVISGETAVEFEFDPAGGLLQGAPEGDEDGAGSALLVFDMFRSTPVTGTVTRFDVDDPDIDPSYRFNVKIGDHAEKSTGSFSYPAGDYGSGFGFTEFVNPANPVVKVRFSVQDVDLIFDDTMDLNPRSGESSLTLLYNLTTFTFDEEGGAFSFPSLVFPDGVAFSHGAGDDDPGTIFFTIGAGPDTDGDGLFDVWETNGIDVNGDGTIDLQLNTNPNHKDVFVEADAMSAYAPLPGVMDDVVAAFAAAPDALVDNPDGLAGVTLHVQVDETNIPTADWVAPGPNSFPNEYGPTKENLNPLVPGGFGSVADRASPNAANILAAQKLVYHYSIFAGSNLPYGGLGEIYGNDFITAVGFNTREVQGAVFMHELGHNLDLLHGGDQRENNYKANYHSIMNYAWSYPSVLGSSPTPQETAFHDSWSLDYSRDKFLDLNEEHLNETTGIGGHPGHMVRPSGFRTAGTIVPESGPVDWNGNGNTTDTDVELDINGSGTIDTLFTGFEDWSHLKYDFRNNFRSYELSYGNTADETGFLIDEINQALTYVPSTGNGADDLILRRNGLSLELFDTNAGIVVNSRLLAETRLVQILGIDGESDALTIDYGAGGFFALPDGIVFDGGTGGNDLLKIVGTGATTGAYTPSATTFGDGRIQINLGAESTEIAFSGLEPVEVSGMAAFAFISPNSDDALTVSGTVASGGDPAYVLAGTSGGVAFESLTIFDITSFTLDAASNDGATPDDSVSVDLGAADADVAGIIINTGAGDDAISVTASAHTAIQVNAGADDDTLHFAGESLTFAMTDSDFTTVTREAVTYADVQTLALHTGLFHTTGTVTADVTVNGAATLGGTGTVAGDVTVNPGGTVDPGVGGPGTLRTGNISFAAGAAYQVQLNGLVPDTEHDLLRVVGTVDLTGSSLTGSLGYTSIPGDELVIIHNDGSDAVVGKFANVTAGDIVVIGGKEFAIDYAFDGDGDGQFNDVALLRYGAELAPNPCDPKRTALFVSATAGDDIIRFVSVTGNSRMRVLINGQDLGTFKPSGLLIAFGQAGNDRISVEVPSREAWLYGQRGNDTLLTGNNDAILVGGLGDDELVSGNGKDILIGGVGADVLNAGNGEDLLIAGSTVYDTNTAAHREALCKIQDEWLHGSGGYSGRIAHLRTGGGRNGSAVLNGTTVFHDTDVDRLTGGNGTDWFLLDPGDLITDKAANEIASLLP